MFVFDVRTAYLINGLLYFVLPVVVWVVLVGQRTLPVALWCGGGMMVGAGLVLTSFRGFLPGEFIGTVTALVITGAMLRIQSLRMDLAKPWPTRWIVAVFFISYLAAEVIRLGLQSESLRFAFANVLQMVVNFLTGLTARQVAKREQSRNAAVIAWTHFAIVPLLGSRFVLDIPDPSILISVFSLTALFISVIANFGYIGLALDRMTRRELELATARAREDENRRLGAQIMQLDRQRSFGEMSASLGHELSQPLAAILTNVGVAKRGIQMGEFNLERVIEFLDKIANNTRRASQIIERIRGFIRPAAAVRKPVDLRQGVAEVAELVADLARKQRIRVILPGHVQPIMVMGDPIQLSQIILNVLRNAIDALRQAAQREIHVALLEADGRVILRIRDTGPGLTPEALTRAGTPFFTTKPEGLGMGLSISRSIAAQHGGTLTFANVECDAGIGGGTIVDLNLPALPEARK